MKTKFNQIWKNYKLAINLLSEVRLGDPQGEIQTRKQYLYIYKYSSPAGNEPANRRCLGAYMVHARLHQSGCVLDG